ncbi:cbb3-type cytochrome c oxidase N-terminal domain-containing protein [uncultured Campylobacter sp.]|uniref:cbb3-type cytochrome c oxidase N-terminal domain-containing protein n=1 Tax=uncultured Campylobacter sp. TaxID=218934 RepID=UPI0026239D10|nr:cbb3-type cytochrome c oxidase N-terminal domain-containing protein [uncultured Campylobacter sp.]
MKFLNLQDHINLLTILAAIALFVVTFYVVGIYLKQMKEKQSAQSKEFEDSWDGIGEGRNPLPIGWSICFVAMIVWAIWYYLVGYPLNSYSQIGEYNDEVKVYNEKFEAKFANPTEQTLTDMGEGLYLVECFICHGINARGINGKAADLTVWGTEQGLIDSINKGSRGLGYPLGEMTAELVDKSDAPAVAAYVAQEISAIKKTSRPDLVEKGKELFLVCSACHGEDGKGMDGMAPDLTKYGSPDFVVDVLNRGKAGNIGEMPSYTDGRISDIQKRALGYYIKSINK